MLHQKKIVLKKLFEENTFQKIFVTLTILTFSLLTKTGKGSITFTLLLF